MPASPRALFDWHARPGAFERLSPAWQGARVVSRQGGITDGGRVVVEVPVLGGLLRQRLEMVHDGYVDGVRFRDTQRAGPFARWTHTHTIEAAPDGSSVLDDSIDYALPMGVLGDLAAGWYVRGELERLFRFRHDRTRSDMSDLAATADRPRLTVAITGGTGMIGSALTALLRTAGHTVRWITRHADASRGDIGWDPDAGRLDPASLTGVEAVVHLAGANVGQRWTESHRAAILQSREQGTRTLVSALLRMPVRPKVLISGSAIGYYGDTGAKVVDESASNGQDFLARVCTVWERETAPAADAGIRVALARTGVVLSPGGGALAKMLPAFRLGLGGPMGSGEQWMSWITLDDEVRALRFLLETDRCSGAFNLTAPTPATNADFASAMGHVLQRPSIIPIPAFALRALFGEMADATILSGQRVLPTRLTQAGFSFNHATLEAALRSELGR